MTEWEWLVESKPREMLQHLRGRVSDRKLILFACACCFEVRKSEPHSEYLLAKHRQTMLFADRPEERHLIADWSSVGGEKPWPDRPFEWALEWAAHPENPPHVAVSQMAGLLRELLGNPYRPVVVEPAWLTPEVRAVAEAAYDALPSSTNELDSTHLAILADALEEAGAAEALTRHLRGFALCARCGGKGETEYDCGYYPAPLETCRECGGTGWISCHEPHLRGCWVVDLLLGKR